LVIDYKDKAKFWIPNAYFIILIKRCYVGENSATNAVMISLNDLGKPQPILIFRLDLFKVLK
jgi:hypothetical protein